MSLKHSLFCAVLFLLTFGVSGQTLQDPAQAAVQGPIFQDSLGKVYLNPQSSLRLWISDNPQGNQAVPLIPAKSTDSTFRITGNGTHRFQIRGSSQRFPVWVNGTPPATSWKASGKYLQRPDTLIGAKNLQIQFLAQQGISPLLPVFVSVNGQEFKPHTHALELSQAGHYTLRYYSADKTGNRSPVKTLQVKIDTLAPQTRLELENDFFEDILSARTQIRLNASSPNGIDRIWYSMNEQAFSPYRQPITTRALEGGQHRLRYYAEDPLGNKEEIRHFDFYVDLTPPILIEEIMGNTFIAGGREYSSGRSQLRFTSVDNKAGVKAIYYTINNGPQQLYERPVFLSAFSGSITINAWAVDRVNNRTELKASESRIHNIPWVDLNPPEVSHSLQGKKIQVRDTLYISPQTRIQLNARDRESGLSHILFRLNNLPDSLYAQPLQLPQEGYYQIYFAAFDNVENMNSQSFDLFVDNTPPQIQVHFSLPGFETREQEGMAYTCFPPHLKIYLAANDRHSGTDTLLFSLNDDPERTYTAPLANFKEGSFNKLHIKAIDVLGNSATQTIYFHITP